MKDIMLKDLLELTDDCAQFIISGNFTYCTSIKWHASELKRFLKEEILCRKVTQIKATEKECIYISIE